MNTSQLAYYRYLLEKPRRPLVAVENPAFGEHVPSPPAVHSSERCRCRALQTFECAQCGKRCGFCVRDPIEADSCVSCCVGDGMQSEDGS